MKHKHRLQQNQILHLLIHSLFSPPASVTLDDELIQYNDGTVIVAMNITIGASPDNFVREYQVEYKRTSDANFIVHSKGTVDLFHRVLNVISVTIIQ